MKNMRLLMGIIAGGIFLFLLVVLFLFLGRQTSSVPQAQPARMPTPTRFPQQTTAPTRSSGATDIRVQETDPIDGKANVPVNQDIRIIFTSGVSLRDLSINTSPEIRYRMSNVAFQSNTVILDLQEPLQPGVRYTVSVTYKPYPYYPRAFSFTTAGPTQAELPDTAPPDTDTLDRTYLNDQPDVYLRNKTPYETAAFRITSEYTTFPHGHYGFDVTLNGDQQQAEAAFKQWLYSLGMNDAHIGQLDIRYQ